MPSSYAEALPTADRVISSAFPGFTVTHYTGPVAPDSITVDHPAVFFVPIGQEVTVICRMENSGETELTLTRNSVLISGSTRLQAVGWSTAAQMLRIELSDEVRSQLEDAGWVSDKKLHVVEDELLHRVAELLLPAIGTGCHNGCVFAESAGATLIAHIDRNYGMSSDRALRSSGERLPASVLRQIRDLVEARLPEPIKVRDLADIAHFSEFHFLRAFKRSTGLSPHQYVTSRRMERAKILLTTTGTPVADIAWRVGFSNTSHFNAQFRKHTGLTPGGWREHGTQLRTVS